MSYGNLPVLWLTAGKEERTLSPYLLFRLSCIVKKEAVCIHMMADKNRVFKLATDLNRMDMDVPPGVREEK